MKKSKVGGWAANSNDAKKGRDIATTSELENLGRIDNGMKANNSICVGTVVD